MEHRFIRTELVLGAENLQRLQAAKVAVVGLGGVGTCRRSPGPLGGGDAHPH